MKITIQLLKNQSLKAMKSLLKWALGCFSTVGLNALVHLEVYS
jgi:hypothetical protein